MIDLIQKYIEDNFIVKFDGNDLTVSSDLFEGGIIDSFGMVEMISFLEKEFDVHFNDEDLMSPKLSSLEGIVSLLKSKKNI
jgi:D-alanine--poly(phosphoribitol) ligase subunit 2